MRILGIETSCDETAMAVVEDGRTILSSLVSSQVACHVPYGGVVPEIASRQHLSAINELLSRTLAEAEMELFQLDGVAVTRGPGLIGALLVGVCFAKGLSFGLEIPLKGIHHLEGHIYSVLLSHAEEVRYPAVALLASGGHSHIYSIPAPLSYRIVAKTRDDAAGETLDKVGKAMGFPYPAGPVIDRLAEKGDPARFPLPRPTVSGSPLDMSFSGLKTACLRILAAGGKDALPESQADMSASLREAVCDILIDRLERAVALASPKTILVGGGVAANSRLRNRCREFARRTGIRVLLPAKELTGDNGAMVAAAGAARLASGSPDGYDLEPSARLSLESAA